MLHWLGDKILSLHLPDVSLAMFGTLMFALFVPFTIFFFISRRVNARAEPAVPGPRRLLLLAQALKNMEGHGRSNVFLFFVKKVERPVVWLLRKADRLLPDANTGRRLNFFVLLFIAFSIGYTQGFHVLDKTSRNLMELRDAVLPMERASSNLWMLFASFWVFSFLIVLPIFVVGKNRELHLDIAALFSLIVMSFAKLVFCWPNCCFGIPFAWGVYFPDLGTTVFPVQLLEFATCLLISILAFFYILYAKSYKPGYGCTFCTFLYSLQRFYAERFRYHSELYRPAEAHMVFGFGVVQIMCLIGCVISIVWLFLLPLEKKLLDRLGLFIMGGRLRKRAANHT